VATITSDVRSSKKRVVKQTIASLLNEELDAIYRKTATPMLQQIQNLSLAPTGEMQVALRELDVVAQEKQELEEKFTATDAQLQQTLSVYAAVLGTTASLILANDNRIQNAGIALAPSSVTTRVFFNLSNSMIAAGQNPLRSLGQFQKLLESQGVQWTIPDLNQLSKLKAADFISTAAYQSRMEAWGAGYAELSKNTILNGIEAGNGPQEIARLLRQHAENIPVYAAENLTRTLQVTAYRESALAMETINGGFIKKKIRIAKLDERTCLSCIELHGSELAPGKRVDDHYRGRCTEFYVVPGGPEQPEFMQADSTPGNRRFVKFQKGSDWFNSLPESRQRAQQSFLQSPGKWKAFKSGTPLSAFVTEHTDDVFGRQLLEGSLKNSYSLLLGSGVEVPALEKMLASKGNMPLEKVFSHGQVHLVTNGVVSKPPLGVRNQLSKYLQVQDETALKGVKAVFVYSDEASWKAKLAELKLVAGEGKAVGGFFLVKDSAVHMPMFNGLNLYSFTHEVGHGGFYASSTALRWGSQYNASKGFDRHTEYSKVNASEGFAETYVAWIASGKSIEWESFEELTKVLEGVGHVK